MSLSTREPSCVAAGSDASDEAAQARRMPAWLFTAVLVGFGLIWPGGRSVLLDMAAELVMISLLILAVVRTSAFRDWWQDVPRFARRCSTFVLVAMIFVQFFSISSSAFPLTHWAMYTSERTDVPAAYQLVGYTAAGDEVDFVPSISNRTLSTKLPTENVRRMSEQVRRARLDPANPERLEEASQKLEHMINLLAGLHNGNSPDALVVEVAVFRISFTPEQRQTGEGDTEAVWRQDVNLDDTNQDEAAAP